MSRLERNAQRDDRGVVEHGEAELVHGILSRLPEHPGDRSLEAAYPSCGRFRAHDRGDAL